MEPSSTIVFALTRHVRGQRYLASLVMPHRNIDVTFLQRSWAVKACILKPVELTCATLPLETVMYVNPPMDLKPPLDELIRYAGQNQVELEVSSPAERLGLPLFLTTSQPLAAWHYRIRFRLRTRYWAEVPDFQADHAYWIRCCQEWIVCEKAFYEERLAYYQRRREVAAQLEIGTGDVLPLTVRNETGRPAPGCLRIGERESAEVFQGTFSVLGEQDLARCKWERRVRWEESGKIIEKEAVIAEITR